jgi:hypothetical protein
VPKYKKQRALNVGPMECPQSILGFSRRGQFHLPHAQKLSFRICDDRCGEDSHKGSEEIVQVLSGEGTGQSVNPQFSAQGIFLCGQVGRSEHYAFRTQNEAYHSLLIWRIRGAKQAVSLRPASSTDVSRAGVRTAGCRVMD